MLEEEGFNNVIIVGSLVKRIIGDIYGNNKCMYNLICIIILKINSISVIAVQPKPPAPARPSPQTPSSL